MTTPGGPAGAPPPEDWGPPPGWAAPPPSGGYGPPPGWQAPAAQGYGYGPGGYGPSGDDTTWALLAHLSWFVIPLIGPLIVFLAKPDAPFARRHAAEALNFHLTLLLALIVSAILVVVIIGFFLLIALGIASLVLTVLAAVAAGRGQDYRYPLTIRFVKP